LAKPLKSQGRFLISAANLEAIARCPLSVNYLSRIQSHTTCQFCIGLKAATTYLLQRSFRGTHLPTTKRLQEIFARSLVLMGDRPWAESIAGTQTAILDHMRDWGLGVWEKIDGVNIEAETHHGAFTIHQLIDAVLKFEDNYILTRFICESQHKEQFLTYQTIHGSLWLREAYGIETNKVMIIQLTPWGPRFNPQTLELSTKILRNSIDNILSTIEIRDAKTPEEHENKLACLPANPGPLCYDCGGCFYNDKI
jgi:hypothetical protein